MSDSEEESFASVDDADEEKISGRYCGGILGKHIVSVYPKMQFN